MPHFTIIVPVYNGVKTISRTINSILDQDFHDYEIIVQDGMSDDGTLLLVKKNNDSRLHIYSEKDNGIYDAMNKALQRASGRWLLFLGSDDYFIDKSILSKIYTLSANQCADMIYGNVFYEAKDRTYDGKFSSRKLMRKNICHQSIFYASRIFTDLKKNYIEKYKVSADYNLNLDIFLSGRKTIYVNETISFFTKGGESRDGNDVNFKNDFPVNASIYIENNRSNFIQKVLLLSYLICRTILKYHFKRYFIDEKFANGNKILKYSSLLLSPVVYPFYVIDNRTDKI